MGLSLGLLGRGDTKRAWEYGALHVLMAGVGGAADTVPLWQSALSITLWPLAALALAVAAFRRVTP